ncbi:hypothetical protein CSA08_00135 [Candidatus Gracilibacteria bacterium]|nr:MAG: hypothetical protein CSA08_00135 [Candidatus Gracilibacteria bacterium]
MVTFITGFPGSGKSYFEIDKIYNIMSKNHTLSKTIEVIYTNINGLKYDKFPQNGIQLKKLNIDDFYRYLTESFALYEKYKNDDDVDSHLVEHSKKNNYYNSLIAFDECHDFLSNQDRIKVYWLTYHRHLYQEVDLLTQNKSLINSKYRAIPEIFIEAQPRSKKLLSNTLSYKHYASFAMRKSDLFTKSSIKTKKEIFALYGSGNTSKQKSILLKFILIIVVGLLITTLLFYLLLDSFNFFGSSKKDKDKSLKNDVKITNTVNNTTIPVSNNINSKLPSSKHSTFNNHDFNGFENYVFKVVFDSKEGYYIFNNYYSVIHFRKFLKATNSKVLSKYSVISTDTYKLNNLYVYTNDNALKKFFVLPKEDTNTNQNKSIEDIKINF